MRPVTLSLILALSTIAAAGEAAHAASLAYPLSSRFGWRHDPIRGGVRLHQGIDMPARQGAVVRAAADGVVSFSGVRGGYGMMVEIDHGDGTRTRYAHLSRIDVLSGDRVGAASLIGAVGSTGRSTGPHLHFEYLVHGQAVDPLPYMNQLGVRPDSPAWQDHAATVRSMPVIVHRSDFARARDVVRSGGAEAADDEIPRGALIGGD